VRGATIYQRRMTNGYPQNNSAAPAYFDAESVGIATFLATPLAGSILHASNLWTARAPLGAVFSVLSGVIVTVALVGIGVVASGLPRPLLWLLSVCTVAGARAVARSWLTENNIDQQVQYQQARFRSRGLVALLCLPVTALLFGLVLLDRANQVSTRPAQASSTRVLYQRLRINSVTEMQYGDGATEVDARTVADSLLRLGWFSQTLERSAAIGRDERGFVLKIPVVSTINGEQVTEIQQLARIVAGALHPQATMKLELTDTRWEAGNVSYVTPLRAVVISATATVMASTQVSDDEAQRVGAWLVEERFFNSATAKIVALDRAQGELALVVSIASQSLITPALTQEAQAMAHRFAARMAQAQAQLQLSSTLFLPFTTVRGTASEAQPLAPPALR
jgi:hypothetical protein